MERPALSSSAAGDHQEHLLCFDRGSQRSLYCHIMPYHNLLNPKLPCHHSWLVISTGRNAALLNLGARRTMWKLVLSRCFNPSFLPIGRLVMVDGS